MGRACPGGSRDSPGSWEGSGGIRGDLGPPRVSCWLNSTSLDSTSLLSWCTWASFPSLLPVNSPKEKQHRHQEWDWTFFFPKKEFNSDFLTKTTHFCDGLLSRGCWEVFWSIFSQILWVFLENKQFWKKQSWKLLAGFRGLRRSFDGTSTALIVCICFSSSGLFTMRDHAAGLGDFIGRGFYLQQNPRKQERTEGFLSCSHQNLQTQNLSSSRTETTPRGEDFIINTWQCPGHHPSHKVWNEGKR